MGLLELLPLMFAVVTSAVHKPQCQRRYGQGCPERITNNPCPTQPRTVVNSLDPDNSGVERLVIFLYKKTDTGEFISFIPGKQFQHQILDYPEEYGTINEISVEMSIAELYENSPSKDMRETSGIDRCNQNQKKEIIKPNDEKSNEVVIVVDTQPTDETIVPGGSRSEQHENKESESWHIPVNNDSELNKLNPSRPETPAQINPLPEYIPGTNKNYATETPGDNIETNEYNPQNSAENYPYPYDISPQNANDQQNHQEQDSENTFGDDESPMESNPNYITEENANDHQNYLEQDSDKPLIENDYPYSPNMEQPEENNEDHHTTGDDEDNSPVSPESNIQVHPRPQKPIKNPQNSADHWETIDDEGNINSPTNKIPRPQKPIKKSQDSADNLETDDEGHIYSPPNKIPPRQHMNVPVFSHGKFIGWSTHTVSHKKTYWQSHGNTPHIERPRPFDVDPTYYVPGSNIQPYDIDRMKHEQSSTFDNWLQKQLNIITINGNAIPTSPDDINALQIEIRNILLQNGYMVTKQGSLIYGHGTVSSLDNVKLRPILIGKSVSRRRFSKHSRSDVQIKIPSNTPFLEGILVTMVNPPKVLGIVPLSITSLPEKLGPGQNKDEITIQGHVEPGGQKSLLKILPISHLVSFRKGTRTGKHTSSPKFRSTWYKNDNNYLKKALAELMYKGKKKEHVAGGYFKKPKEKGKSEEVPDYRIIGGITATVSGTPILVKGRSGRNGYATRLGIINK